jgi:hypothetical protein
MISAKEIEEVMKNQKLLAELKEPLARLHESMNKGHEHKFVIPVAWQFESDENIGGDYAGAALVLDRQWVTRLMCECGKEMERDHAGKKFEVE